MEPLPTLPETNIFYELNNFLQSEDNLDDVPQPNEGSVPSEWMALISQPTVADGMAGEQGNTSGTILPSSRDVTEEGEQNSTTWTMLPSSRDLTEGERNSTTFVGLVEEVAIDSREDGRKTDKKVFNSITLEQLQQQYGKPLEAAAKALGVSKATLKRAKDRHGIARWPSHPQNKVNPSLFKTSTLSDISGTSKDRIVNMELHCGRTVVSMYFNLLTQDLIGDLRKSIQRCLNFESEDFKLKYWTEENRFLSIRDDDDLKDCINQFESKTTVKIYVIPKSNKSTTSSKVGSCKRPRVVDQYHHPMTIVERLPS